MHEGIHSKNCITDFPAITFPCHATLITGTYTGDYRKELCHGIPLGDWIGRDTSPPHIRSYAAKDLQIYKANEDLGQNCKTILEMVDEENKVSIAQFLNRGANYFFPENKFKLIYSYLLLKKSKNIFKMATKTNEQLIKKLINTFTKPKKYFNNNEAPIASLIWFMSSDILMHIYGFNSREYILNLVHIDKVIGKLLKKLEELGYLEETAIAITSDHGNYKGKTIGTLENLFEPKGLNHYHPRNNRKGNFNLSEFASIGFFNFKGTNKSSKKAVWSRPKLNELTNFGPKKINLFEFLFKIKGSCLMLYRDDNSSSSKGIIHIKYKEKKTGRISHGLIEYRGSGKDLLTKYSFDDDCIDVLHFSEDIIGSKVINGKSHNLNEWTNATYHLNYPMYPDLISRHFKNPRSCDIILSTEGDVIFNYQHGRKKHDFIYTHDIGSRKNTIVPLIIGGSNEIPTKEIRYCKITDIVPSLLDLIGKKYHESVIGHSLI